MCIVGQIREKCQCRDGGAVPTTPTLVGPKMLSFMVEALYFQSFGWTNNNCQVEMVFRWLDQSCTASAAPVLLLLRIFNCIICSSMC